ncbi:hypothetical protein E4P28_07725 [Rothia dentocariosa]|uniref:hypothetical protein n=1 Tax=Rothia dentocariosa TaxID=2047 RepID=UPI001072AC53|nr:hypothetical protein [Rothia dentocariosa]TFI34334.1 hypothetical protein E4P28_07725 [Rothia dentocariosa]
MAETPAVTYVPWPIAHTPAPLENGEPVAGRHPAEYLGPGVLHYIGSEFHLMAELNPYPFDPENSRSFRGDLVHRNTYFSDNITFSFEADEDYLYFTAHFFLTWQEPSDRTYARARVDRNFALRWEQRDDDPQRAVYIEAVFMTLYRSLSVAHLELGDGEFFDLNEDRQYHSYHMRQGDDIIRLAYVTKCSSRTYLDVTTDYRATVLSYCHPPARLAWSVPTEDARYTFEHTDPLIYPPDTGEDIPEYVRRILPYLPTAPYRRAKRTYAPASAYRATFTPWPMTVQQGEDIRGTQYPWQKLVSGEFLIQSPQSVPFRMYLDACEPDWDSMKGDRQVYAELMPNVGGRRPWFGTDFTLCMRRWQNNLVFSAEHLTKWRATDWEVCAIAILDTEGSLTWELRDEVAGRGAYIEALVGHIVDSLGTEPPVLAPGEGKVLHDQDGQVSSVHVNTGEAMLRALITRIWYGVDPTTGQRAPYLYEARVKDQFDENSSGGFSTIAWSSPEKFYYWSWDREPGFVPAVTDPEILRRDEVDLLIPHLPVAPGVPSQENEDDAAVPWFYGASGAVSDNPEP